MKLRIWPFRIIVKLGLFLIFYTALINTIQKTYTFPHLTFPLPILVTLNSPLSSAVGAFDILQLALANAKVPLLVFASIFIIGSILGKIFCGWACPVGFFQELIIMLRRKQPHIARSTDITAKKIKYFMLAIVLLLSLSLALASRYDWGEAYKQALGVFSQGPTITIFPDATLLGTVPKLISNFESGTPTQINALLVIQFLILGIFIAGSYSAPWFWCRYLCPLGALMGIFAKFSLLGLRRSPTKCERCPYCVRACPTQVRILELPWRKFNDPDCVLCFECIAACPHGALSPKIP